MSIKYDVGTFVSKVEDGLDKDTALEHVIDNNPDYLDYERAEARFKIHYSDDPVDLVKTRLEGLDQYGRVNRYKIMQSDPFVCRTLGITAVEEEVIDISIGSDPVDDPLLTRLVKIMGEEVHLLSIVLAGGFKEKEHLDDLISSIALSYYGTPYEDEIDGLLEDVRQRGLASKQFREMGFSINRPNQDDLSDFKKLIET